MTPLSSLDTVPPTAGVAVIDGALSQADIDAEVKRGLPGILACYQQELTKHPTLAGELVEGFVVGADGSVSKAWTAASTLGSRPVEKCVDRRVRAMHFPAPTDGAPVEVRYPFTFSPG